MSRFHIAGALAAVLALGSVDPARAADVVCFCADSLEGALRELAPDFASVTGHRLTVKLANLGTNAERVRKGEPADVAIVSPQQWAALHEEKKIDAAIRVVIARVGVGAFVRKDAARPDISTVDALRRTLLEARAIALRNPGRGSPVGATVTALFARLGITDAVSSKLRLTDDRPFAAVVGGEADLGFSTLVEIAATPEVTLVGPVPRELQNFISQVAAIPAQAREPTAARALIEFLRSPHAVATLKAKGFETE